MGEKELSKRETKMPKLSQENAVLLLENQFLKERLDYEKWDLRQMKSNVSLMKKITDTARWNESEKSLLEELVRAIEELLVIVQEKDTTRVIAGHTHLEQALRSLRNSTFGL